MVISVVALLFLGSLLFGQFGSIPIFFGVSLYIHDILLAILVLLSAIPFFNSSSRQSPPLLKPIGAFILAAAVSLIANSTRFPLPDFLSGSLYFVRWIFYAAIFFAVVSPAVPLCLWEWGLYAVGIGFSLLGLLQMFLLPGLRALIPLGWDEHYGRLFSTLLDPNFVGIVFVLIFFLGMYLLTKYKERRLLILLGQLLLSVTLVLTYSRSVYVAFVAGFIIWLIGSKQYVVSLFLVFLAVVYILIPKDGRDVNRLNRMLSSEARINNWKYSIELAAKSPIVGNGFDLLRPLARVERSIDKDGVVSRDAASVDSSLLLVLATTGVLGLFCYAWLLRSQLTVLHSGLGYTGISIAVALFIHSFFNNSLFYAWTMILFWILLGISYRNQKPKATEGKRKRK